MTTAFAPYGFVPLNEDVYLPEWAPAVSRDWPFQDGVSGTIELEITSHTPIFTRDPEDRERFFRGPDGLPAFPGSGLRGAIRTVVEIASYGWMRRVNDHRYGVRDLHNNALYVRHMADIMPALNGKMAMRPTPWPPSPPVSSPRWTTGSSWSTREAVVCNATSRESPRAPHGSIAPGAWRSRAIPSFR